MFLRRRIFSMPSGRVKKIAGHLRIMNVWPPSELMCVSILFCMTRIAVITTMMENTPTKTPSKVSAERSLCAVTALMAMRKLSRSSAKNMVVPLDFTDASLISQRVHRIHSRRAPCGKKSRKQTGDQRNQQSNADDGERHDRRQKSVHHQCQRPGDSQSNRSTDQTNGRRFD